MSPVSGTLTSTGWTTWDRVRDLIGDDLCLWTDLGEPHDGVPAPASLPVGATHLWSWRADRWVRVRLDHGRVLATVLTIEPANGGGSSNDAPSSTGEGPDGGVGRVAVTITRSAGIPWGADLRARPCHLRVTLLRTEGPNPITFMESRGPDSSGKPYDERR